MIASTQSETNEELVARFQAGDRSALDTLVRQNEGLMAAVCRMLVKNDTDREDAMQEAAIKLIRCAELFDVRNDVTFAHYAWKSIDGTVRKWRIRQRLVLIPVKQVRRGVAVVVSSVDSEIDSNDRKFISTIPDSSPKPVDEIAERDELQHLQAVLKERLCRLTPRNKSLLAARFIHGMSYEQIGRAFKLNSSRVRTIILESVSILKRIHYEPTASALREQQRSLRRA